MGKLDEVVYAIKVSELSSDGPLFNGFQQPPDQTILNKIYSNTLLMTRRECENDPKFKHIIPYTIITSGADRDLIFVVKRTSNQTEARLHDKASIGIGGHVGPIENLPPKDAIFMGMLRELQEEVHGMKYIADTLGTVPRLVGFVNYDLDSVGQVHFGIVYNAVVSSRYINTIKVKETENMVGKWMSYVEALKVPNYETWSSLILGLL
jgi:predicted NUDIX family phosphoesterase